MKTINNSKKSKPIELEKSDGVILIVFRVIMNYVSRMHVIGIVKQVSVMLERRLRSIASTLLRHIVLRNHVIMLNGIRYYLSDERLESLITLFPEYEEYIWKYFKPAWGSVFVDVGAHVGKYSLQVARIVGTEGLVIALEPHPDNYRALLKGIQLNAFKNVIALNVAAWDKDCKLRLFTNEAAVHHSAKIDLGLGYVEVNAMTIDHAIAMLNPSRVDWIKIDVEDAETEAVKGLQKTLAKYAPRLIIELQWKNVREILRVMEKYHYRVMPIAEEQNPRAKWGYFYCEPLQPNALPT